jgi:hypothetical protein
MLYVLTGTCKGFIDPLSCKHFNVFVFSSAIIFAIIHVNTLDDIDSIFIKILLCLIAYIPVAIYLTYVRVRYGFIYAILAHAFLNGNTILLNSIINL